MGNMLKDLLRNYVIKALAEAVIMADMTVTSSSKVYSKHMYRKVPNNLQLNRRELSNSSETYDKAIS